MERRDPSRWQSDINTYRDQPTDVGMQEGLGHCKSLGDNDNLNQFWTDNTNSDQVINGMVQKKDNLLDIFRGVLRDPSGNS